MSNDPRKPSPPFGYSRQCTHTRDQQIHIVAEFHAHRIKANRIAYRVGIDLELIEQLLAGQVDAKQFKRLVAHYRKHRRAQSYQDSYRVKGIGQAELQHQIEREYAQTTGEDFPC